MGIIMMFTPDNEIKGTLSLRKIVEKLNYFKAQIEKNNKNTEQEFIDIGQKLQSYLSNSKSISEIASEAAESVAKKVLDNGVVQLNSLLVELKDHFSKSIVEIKNDKNELVSILDKIMVIIDEIDGFKKIVKHLKVLGISTKIEIARLGTDDKGFSALVQNVDRLSDVIDTKAKNISTKANFLASEINKTTIELDKLETEQINQSTVVLNSAEHSVIGFKNQYAGNSNHISNILNSNEEITQSIGNIVVSIQFHDITRQQMEHVNMAFDDAINKIESINSPIDESAFISELGSVIDLCELQAVQLVNSLNEFMSAVEEIINSLIEVKDSIGSILFEAEKLFAKSNSKENFLELVKKELFTISDELKKNAIVEKKLYDSINSVVDVVEDLAKFVIEIENIGDEIEIIALNAIIKAAHVGNEGSALGILAESIQRLSIEAKLQTGSITKKLNIVNEISQTLRIDLNNSDELLDNDTKTISTNSKIENMVNDIILVENDTKKLFFTLNSDIQSLLAEIKSNINKIEFHNKIKNNINLIIEDIDKLVNDFSLQYGNEHKKTLNHTALLNKYTMHSEREIHKNFLSAKNGKKKVDKKVIQQQINNDDLGDNVELF